MANAYPEPMGFIGPMGPSRVHPCYNVCGPKAAAFQQMEALAARLAELERSSSSRIAELEGQLEHHREAIQALLDFCFTDRAGWAADAEANCVASGVRLREALGKAVLPSAGGPK